MRAGRERERMKRNEFRHNSLCAFVNNVRIIRIMGLSYLKTEIFVVYHDTIVRRRMFGKIREHNRAHARVEMRNFVL